MTILIFGVAVLVHEMGHFWVAKRAGIFVEEFAIGMGPKLLAFGKGKNDSTRTLFTLRAIPIGGFCKLLGEEESNDDSRALNSKNVPTRMLVMAAGALINFLLAFIIFFALTWLTGYTTVNVLEPVAGSPAMQAGLQAGDRITHINGHSILLYEDFYTELQSSGGSPLELRFTRDGVRHTINITPMVDETGDYKMGIYMENRLGLLSQSAEGYPKAGVLDSIAVGAKKIVYFIKVTFDFIIGLFTRQTGVSDMAGPIGVGAMVDQVYTEAISYGVLPMVFSMLELCALLNANLGFFNLLPLPALDGGKLIFLLYEAVRRKPVTPEREGMVHFVGFVLLMILAAFIAYQDIVRIL